MSTTIAGNLTRDPELRYTAGGTPVANFTVAVNYSKDDPGNFIDCTAWEDLAENVVGDLRKGDRVLATGILKQRSWETKDGDKRSKLELTVREAGPSLRWQGISAQQSDGPDTIDDDDLPF